jgi:hypothetical protein
LTNGKTKRETPAHDGRNLTEAKKPMNAKLERITPETAAVMLQLNKDNRPVNTRHVKSLAREIKEGRWQVNGDTIAFATDRLVDGQHRLMAIIESGTPVETFVVRGVSSESFLTKDAGKRRRTSDAMAIAGIVYSNDVAAATLKVWLYVKYGKIGSVYAQPSTSELMEFYEQNTGILKSVQFVGRKSRIMTPSLCAALHYLFSGKHQEMADRFTEDMMTGADLGKENPIFLLRQRLLENITSKSKLPQSYIAALAIKAWNFVRDGKSTKQLRFLSDEAYPVIK